MILPKSSLGAFPQFRNEGVCVLVTDTGTLRDEEGRPFVRDGLREREETLRARHFFFAGCRSPLSPCPGFAGVVAFFRSSWERERFKSSDSLMRPFSSRRMYRLSPGCGSMSSRFFDAMVPPQ